MNPETSPMTIAAQGATNPDAAVIATSAARTPFSIIDTSGFLITIHDVRIPPSAPAAAARLVVSATYPKYPILLPVTTASVEPGLKPNQPNQRMIVPRTAYGMLCPGIGFARPSFPNLPIRGPSSSAPASAASAPW